MSRIEVVVEDELLDKLSESFFWKESRDRGKRNWEEVLNDLRPNCRPLIIARVNDLSIKIWADEHPPPHFHVSYQGQDASFSILDCSRLPGVRGLERYESTIRDWW